MSVAFISRIPLVKQTNVGHIRPEVEAGKQEVSLSPILLRYMNPKAVYCVANQELHSNYHTNNVVSGLW